MKGSLRSRVTLWYLGLLTAALIVFATCIYVALQRYLDVSLERTLKSDAHNIQEKFVGPFEVKGRTWLNDELSESFPPENSGQYIRITRLGSGSEYDVLYESPRFRELKQRGASSDDRFSERPQLRRQTGSDDPDVLVYHLPYRWASGTRYLIELGVSRGPVQQLLRRLLAILLILTPGILLVAAAGGYFLMAQPLRPLVYLTSQAERIGTGEMGERLPVIPTGDELERLSHSLNRMISRLEDALAHNRRFSADVSHELRTPLTILRGELEHVMQLRSAGPDVVNSVGSALEEIERLAKIVENLLAISHIDSGGAGIEFTQFDLHATAVNTAEQMRLLAEEKTISLRCDSTGPVYVFGDKARIKQVLVNLLDNAIKYTRDGGHVTISVAAQPDGAVLTVSDDGIGIPADSLPHVFERFYRAERARSRGSAGAGLGLPIVEAICRAHGGTASITSTEGRGTTVEVRLPRLERPPSIAKEQHVVGVA